MRTFDFMTIKNAVPKFIALLLVSICAACFAIHADRDILARLDSMSASDYMQHQRQLYHHSFPYHFVVWLFVGGFYIASVEFIAYVISLCVKKHDAP
jgi:ABC-type multidrug transport system permease subunit